MELSEQGINVFNRQARAIQSSENRQVRVLSVMGNDRPGIV